jgi:site-specific recombinase XerD
MSVKGQKYAPEVLQADEVLALMKACSRRAPTGIRDRALIALLWRTGLRIGEALALQPSDVVAAKGTVRVANGKGSKSRTVGIDDDALAVVERWLDVRRCLGINGKQPVFCTLKGGRLSGQQVRAMLGRRTAKAGLERRVNPHAFRHTLTAEWREEGRDLVEIQDQLGHASLDGTAHYVRKIAPRDLVQIARDRPGWSDAAA